MKTFLVGLGMGIGIGFALAISSRRCEDQFEDYEHPASRRDPEARAVHTPEQVREKMLDKTLADSFPTSDPPSSIPDPSSDSLAS